MKYIQVLLAVVVLTFANGAIQSARPGEDSDDYSVTLFTPRLHGDHFICSAVNVSHKTLGIAITILDDTGQLLVPSSGDANPTPEVSVPPGAEAEINFFLSGPDDGYCKVTVSGTRHRNDVRVELDITWTRTIPGTTIPVLVFRTVEGH